MTDKINTMNKNKTNNSGLNIDESKIIIDKETGEKHYYSETDKINYIYNSTTKQWIPEITADMMNSQQSIYQKNALKRDTSDNDQSDNISDLHVSNLPVDGSIREEQLSNYLKKCGYIKKNEFGRPVINLYVNDQNQFTGCALVSFERKESVPLAILQYDETEITPNNVIRLRKATIEESKLNEANLEVKKVKTSHKDKRKYFENESKYGWSESESKTVIIKNLFSPEEAMEYPSFFNDLQNDLEDETHGCAKCGAISSIHIFEYNPDGVVSVKFMEFESAEKCVALMNNRFFAGRKLSADFYDGFSNFHVEETDENKEIRLKKWESYINKGGESENEFN